MVGPAGMATAIRPKLASDPGHGRFLASRRHVVLAHPDVDVRVDKRPLEGLMHRAHAVRALKDNLKPWRLHSLSDRGLVFSELDYAGSPGWHGDFGHNWKRRERTAMDFTPQSVIDLGITKPGRLLTHAAISVGRPTCPLASSRPVLRCRPRCGRSRAW